MVFGGYSPGSQTWMPQNEKQLYQQHIQSHCRKVLKKTPVPLNTFAMRSGLPNGSPHSSQGCLPKFYPGSQLHRTRITRRTSATTESRYMVFSQSLQETCLLLNDTTYSSCHSPWTNLLRNMEDV